MKKAYSAKDVRIMLEAAMTAASDPHHPDCPAAKDGADFGACDCQCTIHGADLVDEICELRLRLIEIEK